MPGENNLVIFAHHLTGSKLNFFMRWILLTVVMLSFSMASLSAQACNYTFNEYDRFLQVTNKQTHARMILNIRNILNVYFTKYGDMYDMRVELSVPDFKFYVIREDDPLVFNLHKDEPIRLYPMGMGSVRNEHPHAVVSARYRLSRADLERIAFGWPESFKMHSDEGDWNLALRPYNTEKLIEAAKCMLD